MHQITVKETKIIYMNGKINLSTRDYVEEVQKVKGNKNTLNENTNIT